MSRFAIRLAAGSMLASGALLAAAVAPASAADHGRHLPQRPSVVVGAIHSPDRHDRAVRSLDAEWVTVTNTGRRAVDLDGWTLSDRDRHTYSFHHLTLGGHQSVRVHTGAGRNTAHDVYQGRRGYVWDSRSETATLRDRHGRSVDSRSFGPDRSADRDRSGRDHRRGSGH
ncbi:Lamin Tail Domain [Streptomyces sp. DvalAA-14]|uniref:lamin tail domain-containing protein n=1 Tax=unclassified Streptomyces TaxID=2593676 RepID=UPI00081B7991|nr:MULTISPECIES: lamin tail domain-containing protein [unclassified Streptomyces]MYS19967.1 lamin tail domain-containing protein [Streptomyces sp. SID4948]SCD57640.1 Lamin Tail Domain [Streptomyces sp. DvalAA-14]